MWKTASENFSILYYTILLLLLSCVSVSVCVCVLSASSQGTVGVCDLLGLWGCWSICFILVLGCLPICKELMSEFCLIGFRIRITSFSDDRQHTVTSSWPHHRRDILTIMVIESSAMLADKQGAVCVYIQHVSEGCTCPLGNMQRKTFLPIYVELSH